MTVWPPLRRLAADSPIEGRKIGTDRRIPVEEDVFGARSAREVEDIYKHRIDDPVIFLAVECRIRHPGEETRAKVPDRGHSLRATILGLPGIPLRANWQGLRSDAQC